MGRIFGCLLSLVVFGVLIAVLAILGAIAVPNLLYAIGLSHGPIRAAPSVFFVPVSGMLLLAVLGVVLLVPLLVYRACASPRDNGRRERVEETRDIQKLYQGFEDLGRRIEALETILMARERKG
jgi:hypothetical protein